MAAKQIPLPSCRAQPLLGLTVATRWPYESSTYLIVSCMQRWLGFHRNLNQYIQQPVLGLPTITWVRYYPQPIREPSIPHQVDSFPPHKKLLHGSRTPHQRFPQPIGMQNLKKCHNKWRKFWKTANVSLIQKHNCNVLWIGIGWAPHQCDDMVLDLMNNFTIRMPAIMNHRTNVTLLSTTQTKFSS